MKYILIILIFIAFFTNEVISQQSKKAFNQINIEDSIKTKNYQIDSLQSNKIRKNSKDKFIDIDNDGINDNRCRGMGLGCKKANRNCQGRMKGK